MSDNMLTHPFKVAVIDDNAEFGIGVKMLLAKEGVEVHTAADGFEGLELAKQWLPDIVLLDIVMPGMDGIEVCKKIRQIPELMGAYIVMLSGVKIQSNQMAEGMEAGADGYIARPISNRELLARLRAFIRLKKSEKALEITELKYRQIADNVTDVVWITDLELKPTYISPSVKRVYGIKPEDYLKLPLSQTYPPASFIKFRETLADEFSKEQDPDADKNRIFQLEIERYYADGSLGWDSISAVFLRDKDENPIAIQGVSRDITERKQAEIALAESKENLSITLSSIGDGVISTDIKGLIANMNPVAEKLCGWKLSDALGKPLTEVFKIINAETRQTVANPVVKVLEKGEIVGLANHTVLISKDGNEYQISDSAAPIKNKDGKISGVVLVFSDVTEKYAAEESVRESERIHSTLVSNLPGMVYRQAFDSHWTTHFISQSCTTITGYRPDDFVGNKTIAFNDIILPKFQKDIWEKWQTVLSRREPFEHEYQIRRADGKTRWVWERGRGVYDISGKVLYLEGYIEDITERKQAVESLKALSTVFSAYSGSEFLEKVCVHLTETLNVDYAFIGELVSEERVKVITGFGNGEILSSFEYDLINTPCENVIRKSVCYYPTNVRNLFPNDQLLIELNIDAYIGVPLFDRSSKSIGIMVLLKSNKIDNPEVCASVLQIFSERATSEIMRNKAEEALKESERNYRNLIKIMPDGVYKTSHDGKVIDLNPSMLEILGYSSIEEIQGIDIQKELYFSLDEREKKTREGMNNELISYRLRKKDGSEVWVEDHGWYTFNDSGEIVFHEGVIRDITERRQSELVIQRKTEEIEFHNQRLESLLKISQYQTQSIQELLDLALNEAIALTNSKIGYIYFYKETNKQFVLNTWSKDVMQECKVMNPQSIYELDKTGCWGEAVRQRKPIILNDYQAENPHKRGIPEGHVQLSKFLTIPVIIDNKIVAVAGVANKENDYDNSDVRQLSLLMDSVWKISERILLIKDLTIAKEKAEESDKLKSAFLANMSHEIRTPMNGILGFAELLKKPDLTGEEQQDYIRIIEKSGTRMLNIINDIVDISKIEAGLMKLDIKESNINEQIEYIYTFFKPEVEAKGMKLTLNTTLPANEATIATDREKVYAILTNLVKNAIKYSKAGTIEVGYNLKTAIAPAELEFYVKDSGIGIPKDRQEAIFERFIQADISDKMAQQGAGLGLSITRAYVEMLGGKIRVESVEGSGSTFYFTLPYSAHSLKEVAFQQSARSDKNHQIRKLKILIAEDDEVSELLLDNSVKIFGKEILKARTGIEALEVCRRNPDTDLVLMDIQMPEMNGYDVTRKIREFNKEVVIIAQTAYGQTGDREKAIEAGCNDYIVKPIAQKELIALIQKYFGK